MKQLQKCVSLLIQLMKHRLFSLQRTLFNKKMIAFWILFGVFFLILAYLVISSNLFDDLLKLISTISDEKISLYIGTLTDLVLLTIIVYIVVIGINFENILQKTKHAYYPLGQKFYFFYDLSMIYMDIWPVLLLLFIVSVAVIFSQSISILWIMSLVFFYLSFGFLLLCVIDLFKLTTCLFRGKNLIQIIKMFAALGVAILFAELPKILNGITQISSNSALLTTLKKFTLGGIFASSTLNQDFNNLSFSILLYLLFSIILYLLNTLLVRTHHKLSNRPTTIRDTRTVNVFDNFEKYLNFLHSPLLPLLVIKEVISALRLTRIRVYLILIYLLVFAYFGPTENNKDYPIFLLNFLLIIPPLCLFIDLNPFLLQYEGKNLSGTFLLPISIRDWYISKTLTNMLFILVVGSTCYFLAFLLLQSEVTPTFMFKSLTLMILYTFSLQHLINNFIIKDPKAINPDSMFDKTMSMSVSTYSILLIFTALISLLILFSFVNRTITSYSIFLAAFFITTLLINKIMIRHNVNLLEKLKQEFIFSITHQSKSFQSN